MHECETTIPHHFGDLLVYVALCIIVNIGIAKGSKFALMLKLLTEVLSYTRKPIHDWHSNKPAEKANQYQVHLTTQVADIVLVLRKL